MVDDGIEPAHMIRVRVCANGIIKMGQTLFFEVPDNRIPFPIVSRVNKQRVFSV
jgi:hypothetical protein